MNMLKKLPKVILGKIYMCNNTQISLNMYPFVLVFRNRRRRRWRHRNDVTIASSKLIIPFSVNGVILVNKLSQVNTKGGKHACL